jgi:hypothetical protein
MSGITHNKMNALDRRAPPKLENSVLIKVPRDLQSPHITLNRAMRDSIQHYKAEYTKSICQINKRNQWLVRVSKEFNAAILIGQKITYENHRERERERE